MVRKIVVLVVIVSALLGLYGLVAAQSNSTSSADAALEANKELVRRYIEEFANAHTVEPLDELLTDDFQEHNPFAPEYPPGREALKAVAQGIFTAFPDVKVVIDYMVAEGDWVATRHSVTATNTGEFNGLPPSDNEAAWTEMHLFRIKEGQIAEHWVELNLMSILIQIGAMPAPGQ